ncbi:Sec-independent protein translocase subunit TatA [Kitasatospora aburaviensis]
MLRNGLEPWHLLVVVAVVVLLFGSKKLPDMARGLGKSMRILKAETAAMREAEAPPAAGDTAAEHPARRRPRHHPPGPRLRPPQRRHRPEPTGHAGPIPRLTAATARHRPDRSRRGRHPVSPTAAFGCPSGGQRRSTSSTDTSGSGGPDTPKPPSRSTARGGPHTWSETSTGSRGGRG